MKKLFTLCSTLLFSLCFAVSSYAESIIDGVYISEDDGDGCELTITSLGDKHKYGDEAFSLESSGTGACEWSAIGISKNYVITAGSTTSGGVVTFVKLEFPFGPAGKRIALTAFDVDGSIRNEEVFIAN